MLTEISASLGRYSYHPIDDRELLTMVLDVLDQTPGLICEREVIEGLQRHDLVVSRAGVRVVLALKASGSASAVERQAQRYALTEGIAAVAVVTTSPRLARQLMAPGDAGRPPLHTLAGKPFHVITLRHM